MKQFLWVFLFLSLFSCYQRSKGPLLSSQIIDRKISQDQFAITVVLKDGISERKARELALKRGAYLARQSGYDYVKVEKEEKVKVLEVNRPYGYGQGGNLYQELIIDGDFGRDKVSRDLENEGGEVYPALQVQVRGYEEKPSGSSYQICEIIDCT